MKKKEFRKKIQEAILTLEILFNKKNKQTKDELEDLQIENNTFIDPDTLQEEKIEKMKAKRNPQMEKQEEFKPLNKWNNDIWFIMQDYEIEKEEQERIQKYLDRLKQLNPEEKEKYKNLMAKSLSWTLNKNEEKQLKTFQQKFDNYLSEHQKK